MKLSLIYHHRRLLLAFFCMALPAGMLFAMSGGRIIRQPTPPSLESGSEKTSDKFRASTGGMIPAEPAQGSSFNIPRSVIAGGGGTSANGNFVVSAAIGQSSSGVTSGGSYSINGGFFGNAAAGGCAAIAINPASPTLPAGVAGQIYNQQFTQTGGAGGITWNISAGQLPANVALNPSTGLLSGAPTTFGSFSFTVRATGADNCFGERAYTLVISQPCPSIILNPSSPLPDGTFGTAYSQAITTTGGTAPFNFQVTSGSLPAGLILSPTGLLSGTPTVSGSFNFTVSVTDANGCQGSRSYAITIGGRGLMFYALSKPMRLLDTRPANERPGAAYEMPGVKIKGLVTGGLPRTQLSQVNFDGVTIPANARAIVGTATVINVPDAGAYTGTGNVTFYPNGRPKPEVSNLNYAANQTISNSFTVALGDTGAFDIFAYSDVHLVIDVVGYYAPPSGEGLYFHPIFKPVRALETRAELFYPGCVTPRAPLPGGGVRTLQGRFSCDGVTIPAAAQALVGNLTSVNATTNGSATVFAGDLSGNPLATSLAYVSAQAIPNAFITRLANDGSYKLFVSQTTDMLVDIAGYFSPEANDINGQGLLLTLLDSPIRLLETRTESFYPGCDTPRAPLTGGSERAQQARVTCEGVTIPASAKAIIGNATVVNFLSQGSGNVTLYPTAANRPEASNLNYVSSQVIPNAFTVGLSSDGRFTIYVFSTIHLLIDVTGYYAP